MSQITQNMMRSHTIMLSLSIICIMHDLKRQFVSPIHLYANKITPDAVSKVRIDFTNS